MNIENALYHQTYETYIRLEQFINDGSPSGFTFKSIPPEYDPRSQGEIAVPVVQVAGSELRSVGDLSPVFGPGEMPVHPAGLGIPGLPEPHRFLTCSPTASVRTVATRVPSGVWHVKLSYPGVLGRVRRDLPWAKAVAGVENFEVIDRETGGDETFGVMPEVGCRSLNTDVAPNVNLPSAPGFLLRAHASRSFRGSEVRLLPAFSTFSRLVEPSLIAQYLSDQSDAGEALHELLLRLVDGYFTLICDSSIMLEVNAQNLLFELDSDERLRPVFRDLSRGERLLHLAPPSRFEGSSSGGYKTLDGRSDIKLAQIRHSFSFDFKLSGYVVRPLLLASAPAVNAAQADRILGTIRKHVRSFWMEEKGLGRWFPSPGVSYGHERIVLTGARPYVDFGQSFLR